MAVITIDGVDFCDPNHTGEGRSTRIAHGFLGDAPRGTKQTLCDACGTVLKEERPK